jgi:hypothetical protein
MPTKHDLSIMVFIGIVIVAVSLIIVVLFGHPPLPASSYDQPFMTATFCNGTPPTKEGICKLAEHKYMVCKYETVVDSDAGNLWCEGVEYYGNRS